MKKLLFLLALATITGSARSQTLVFTAQQTGNSYKNIKTGKYEAAEVTDANIKITINNKTVALDDTMHSLITLKTLEPAKTETGSTIKHQWRGTDKNNLPVLITFIVQKQNKDAVVEVTNNTCKSYYFGHNVSFAGL